MRLVLQIEDCHERLLRDGDVGDQLHALLALFLLFEQLAFAGYVAAVALGGYVLAIGFDGLAGDYLGSDSGLQRYLEHVAGDFLLETLNEPAPADRCFCSMDAD